MEKRISFKGTPSSQAIKDHIDQCLAKLEHFLQSERQPVIVDVVIEPSKVRAHNRVEIRVHNPDFNVVSDYEGPEMYAVLEKALDAITFRLHEAKRELVDKRQRS